jgi:hypothetical protein
VVGNLKTLNYNEQLILKNLGYDIRIISVDIEGFVYSQYYYITTILW